MSAVIEAPTTAGWSERLYCALLPEQAHLPPERRRLWAYYLLWPNIAFDVYPDQVDFMQMLPISPMQTLIREIPYALPSDARAMRLSRYLNWRINRVVNREDRDLIERVQQGMQSRSFVQGPLSAREVCLSAYAEKIRQLLPLARETQR
jgi:phenylpropionate dioxygenase-like ring-hydroxylating dioxygenase large terminal subunit